MRAVLIPRRFILFGADSRVFVGFERTILPDLLLASASPAREVLEIYQGSDLQSRHVQTSVLYLAESWYVFQQTQRHLSHAVVVFVK